MLKIIPLVVGDNIVFKFADTNSLVMSLGDFFNVLEAFHHAMLNEEISLDGMSAESLEIVNKFDFTQALNYGIIEYCGEHMSTTEFLKATDDILNYCIEHLEL